MNAPASKSGHAAETPMSDRDARVWKAALLFDEKGEVIGRIADVLVHARTKQPVWLLVSFGAFFREDRLVPVFEIKEVEHGFVVHYSKDMVREAPVVSVSKMDEFDEARLNKYWCATRQAASPRACAWLAGE